MYIEAQGYSQWPAAPIERAVRMPRARSTRAGTHSALQTIETVHPMPLLVVSDAGSTLSDFFFRVDSPSPLLVYAGVAFDFDAAANDVQLQQMGRDIRLNAELNALADSYAEDCGHALDTSSVVGLRLFLLTHQWADVPSTLSADADGRVVATWQAGRQSASLKFLDEDQFHYAMVVETSAGRVRPWGTTGRFQVLSTRPEIRSILGSSTTSPYSAA